MDSRRLELKGLKQKSSFSHNLTQPRLCQNRSLYKSGVTDLFYRSPETFPTSHNIIFTQSDTTAVVSQVEKVVFQITCTGPQDHFPLITISLSLHLTQLQLCQKWLFCKSNVINSLHRSPGSFFTPHKLIISQFDTTAIVSKVLI